MLQHMKQKHKKFYVKYCTQHKIKMNLGDHEESESPNTSESSSEIARPN